MNETTVSKYGEEWLMKDQKKLRKARQQFKDDVYKLINLVGKSNRVSSLKIFPGETIMVTLYQSNASPGIQLPDTSVGQFPLKEALRFMSQEIENERRSVPQG